MAISTQLQQLLRTLLPDKGFKTAGSHRDAIIAGVEESKTYTDEKAAEAVKKTGNETIEGVKTFTSAPVVPDATEAQHPVTLAQLDLTKNRTEVKYNTFNIYGLYSSGVWTSSFNWKTEIINASGGDIITYHLSSIINARLILFRDINGNIIDYIDATLISLGWHDGFVTAPQNTVTVEFTTHISMIADSYIVSARLNTSLFTLKVSTGTPRIIIVDKTLTENISNLTFTTITKALTYATGADIIKLFGNESSPYSEYSLDLPNGLTIIGIGKPWIKGELPASALVTDVENKSTIDANDSCTLENLKITAKNMRYPIHADFSAGNTVKNIRNCQFIHYGNKEAYDYQVANSGTPTSIIRGMSAWGGGTKAGDKVFIDSCYFESPLRAFSTHNNVNFNLTTGASFIKITNSEMVSHGIDRDGASLSFLSSVHIQNLISNTNDKIILENCKVNGYITFQGAPTHELYTDSTDLKQVYNTAGSVFLLTENWDNLNVNWYPKIKGEINSFKNTSASTIARGKAVKKSGIGIALFTSVDNVSDFLGIAMQTIELGKSGDVKYSGYIPYKYLTGSTYSIAEGLDISVDSEGTFVQNSSHVVMKSVDNYNIKIK